MNRIGRGAASRVEPTRTRGDKPVAPKRQHLIRTNVTGIGLELSAWQDGGCAIDYFTVEFRRSGGAGSGGGGGGSQSSMAYHHRMEQMQQQHVMQQQHNGGGVDWIVVSSNVPPQSRFGIPDLEPATGYQLRLTAHNNAGPTIAEYYFETLPVGGQQGLQHGGGGLDIGGGGGIGHGGVGAHNIGGDDAMMGGGGLSGSGGLAGLGGSGRRGVGGGDVDAQPVWLFSDAYLVGVSLLAMVSVCLAIVGVCFCMSSRKLSDFAQNAMSIYDIFSSQILE